MDIESGERSLLIPIRKSHASIDRYRVCIELRIGKTDGPAEERTDVLIVSTGIDSAVFKEKLTSFREKHVEAGEVIDRPVDIGLGKVSIEGQIQN